MSEKSPKSSHNNEFNILIAITIQAINFRKPPKFCFFLKTAWRLNLVALKLLLKMANAKTIGWWNAELHAHN